MQTPLVTAIIAAYQQPDFLNAALQSIAAQTHPHIEILIVDDASGPEFTQKYVLPQNAKLIVHPTRQATAAITRNTGLRHATGKYLAFLDQDDLWQPNKIAIQVAALEANPSAVLHFTHFQEIDAGGKLLPEQPKPIRFKKPLREMLIQNFIRSPSQVMMPRAALDKLGLFDESIRGAADWDMWIRAAAAGPLLADPRPLILYRRHAAQWSSLNLMVITGSEAVMAKSRALAKQFPNLSGLLRRRHARWLRALAKIKWRSGQNIRTCMPILQRSLRLWPLELRTYILLLRFLLTKPPPVETPKEFA